MLEPGAAHHLRADQPGAVTPSLAAKSLHRDTCHRGEHEPAGDLDPTDPPGLPKIYLHRGENSTRGPVLTTLARIATIPARDGALAPRFFF